MATPISFASTRENDSNRHNLCESSLVQKLIRYQSEQGGHVSDEKLQEFSQREKVPLYRLQELVSFFNTFRKKPLPKVLVQICRDFSCHLAGSQELLKIKNEFADEIENGLVEIEGKSCIGHCDGPCAVIINHHIYRNLNHRSLSGQIRNFIADKPRHIDSISTSIPDDWNINPYGKTTNYDMFREFVTAADTEEFGSSIIRKLKDATLVGKGGPGQTTYKKWETVRKYSAGRDQRFVVCNADESEPGTFKDRELLLHLPYLVVEGMLIAALTIGAQRAVIYIRHEFEDQIEQLHRCIDHAYDLKICGSNILGTQFSCDVEVFVSPGNYICGEQTALIEAMEDKRGQPRQRPPDLEIQGFRNYPTLVNNVETFAWVPSILKNGPEWYAGLGKNGCKGCRFISISGDVNNPGVFEVPLGATVGDLLELAGGMKDGQQLLAFAPSGPSGGFIPAKVPKDFFPPEFIEQQQLTDSHFDLLKLPLDNNYFRYSLKSKLNLGAAHLFVGDQSDLQSLVRSCTEFYRNESCGKCVPCRLGSEKLVQISNMTNQDGSFQFPDYFQELAELMKQASICGLGQVAMAPLASYKQFFQKKI